MEIRAAVFRDIGAPLRVERIGSIRRARPKCWCGSAPSACAAPIIMSCAASGGSRCSRWCWATRPRASSSRSAQRCSGIEPRRPRRAHLHPRLRALPLVPARACIICAPKGRASPRGRSSTAAIGGATPMARDVGAFCMIGAFAERTVVDQASVVVIDNDIPLDLASLVACGVPAGVGAARHRAKVKPGDSVLVVGCGGDGMNVVQGARLCGASTIIAADIVPQKLEWARGFGATHGVNAQGRRADPRGARADRRRRRRSCFRLHRSGGDAAAGVSRHRQSRQRGGHRDHARHRDSRSTFRRSNCSRRRRRSWARSTASPARGCRSRNCWRSIARAI